MLVIEIIGGALLIMSTAAFLFLAILDLAAVSTISARATTSKAVAGLRQVAANAAIARHTDDQPDRQASNDRAEMFDKSSQVRRPNLASSAGLHSAM